MTLTELNMDTLYSLAALRFNGRARRYFDRRKKSSANLTNGLTGSTDLEDNVSCDPTAVLLKKCKPDGRRCGS